MYAIRYNATLRVCRCHLLCEELASEDKLQTLYNSNAAATFVYKLEPSYTHPHPALLEDYCIVHPSGCDV